MKKRYILCFIILIVLILSGNLSYVSAITAPYVSADSAVLIETSTDKILFNKNANSKLEPASVTKIMTAILTIENCNLNDTVTVPANAVSNIPEGYSIAELKPNEELTVNQLLQLLMVYSANDAANVLAFHIAGSIPNFATQMNAKLQELNIKNTHFTNPSGMHDVNHYSTAYDIALLMKYCVSNTTFQKYASLKSCEIPATNLSDVRKYNNTNPMLNPDSEYYYQPLIATKTGFTTPAKYCLASYAKENDLSMICVILHSEQSSNRFAETKELFQYASKNFSFKDIAKKGDIVTQITVQDATSDTQNLDIVLNDNLHLLARSDLDSVSPQITLKNIPSAPISKGELVGTATYTIDEQTYSIDLVAANDVIKKSSYIYLVMLLAILIIISLLCFRKKKKIRKKRK